MRNCLVADNTTQSTPPEAGVFYLQNGVVENCTAAGNQSTGSSTAPAAYAAAGTFRNNIVWGNTNKSGESGVTAVSASLVTYCCAPDLTGTGNIGEDPVFRNAAKGDYTLRGLSPCIDTGLNQSWMDGAGDLSGAPRVHRGIARGTVDLGCFESPAPTPLSSCCASCPVEAHRGSGPCPSGRQSGSFPPSAREGPASSPDGG